MTVDTERLTPAVGASSAKKQEEQDDTIDVRSVEVRDATYIREDVGWVEGVGYLSRRIGRFTNQPHSYENLI